MAISKGRNELKASIEDTFTIIDSFAVDINTYYTERINSIKDDIKRIKGNIPNDEFEIFQSITNTQKQEIEIYEEFHLDDEKLQKMLIETFYILKK